MPEVFIVGAIVCAFFFLLATATDLVVFVAKRRAQKRFNRAVKVDARRATTREAEAKFYGFTQVSADELDELIDQRQSA